MHTRAKLFGLLTIALTVAGLLSARSAQAYAWMIRHDYSGCSQCHADPSGGSLLTEYGRAQGEFLLRTRYGSKAEEPGKIAGFLGFIETPEPLLLGGDVRPFYLSTQSPGQPAQNRFFWMQADLQGQVTVGRVRANGSIGYAPEGALPAAITHNDKGNLVSRAHWVGIDLGEERDWLLRAGRMNLPFGIRFIEHPFGVRQLTRTDLDAQQQHGVAIAYSGAKVRGELMAVAGNFQVHPDAYRSRGAVGYLELRAAEKLMVGASTLVLHTAKDPLLLGPLGPSWRQAHGIFTRYSPTEVVALLAEADILFQSQPGGVNRTGYATVAQADFEVAQGLHLAATGEVYDATPSDTHATYSAWGTVNWFFAPHADARIDVEQLWMGDVRARAIGLGLHVFL